MSADFKILIFLLWAPSHASSRQQIAKNNLISQFVLLKRLGHKHTFYYQKMLLCILNHMDAMIILYSTYVFEIFGFWQIP